MNIKGDMTKEQPNPFAGTFAFFQPLDLKHKKQNSLQANAQGHYIFDTTDLRPKRSPAGNSTYPKGGVTYSKDSFVVNRTFVFQMKFCGKNPALRVGANRYAQ
jgi:hypothetical protein